jgi:uncharacterized membrane protein
MSVAHLHLALNHFPIVGSVGVALLLGLALAWHSDDLGRAALVFAALVGAVTIAVYFTGEPAEELVERLPGVSKPVTERHEDAALVATIAVAALGMLSLVTLAIHRGRRALSRRSVATALGLAVGTSVVMGYTAFLGGQVRHTEIRAGSASGASAAAAAAAATDVGRR